MKEFLKKHWPISVTLGLLLVMGILMGSMWFGEALFENDVIGISIVLFTFLMVIGVYVEIIYFIYKVIKHKELKEKTWWCVGIYCLHVFLVPYFNLKYICNKEKVKSNLIWYAVLSVIMFVIGILIPALFGGVFNNKPIVVRDSDNLVEVTFPKSYQIKDVGEYDIYASDRKRQINFGVFVYDEDDEDTPDEIMRSRDRWINSTRGPVANVSEKTEELDDRIITTNIYIGTNNGIKNMYFISTVEFKDTDVFVNTMGIYLYEDYLNYKEEFRDILINMEYIGNSKGL